ncbi:MAG: BREX-1 system adenine-specific DNA-methyltransferase PglX, partial [Anaerolineaceae bacterium]|nr:BREX-1 system adenine-specific DNA-methyltransferase PglX [Anaerolineaceae bacterium]
MDTNALKKFAQAARRELLEQVAARLEQVLHTDSVAIREKLDVVNELREQLNRKGKENLIEEVAYTWFNRFCALRYMDVNHITQVGFVSPINGFTQPEILQDAKQGIFDSDWRLDRARVQGLLDGSLPSNNPEQEAYRLLLVAVCNSYAEEMDFLFPKIEDYTELLMPEDLLSAQSVLQSVRETLTAETCQDVEVIGWLYQFYISEKKDEVMAAKGAVAKEDIPAVTQLFTPHWIVRYMVENSLGRLWLLNHPGSKIREQMEYYISPVEEETDYLKVDSPEELKILDPACGSGHILTYAFDLLYAIYEEQGYDLISIPHLILEKNLYGIEIDKRAAMLSSFALMMKAVQKDSRFFRRQVQPNILEMEDVTFTPQEIKAYMSKVGEDLWTQDLWMGLQQFENVKEFGSLIRPVIKDVQELRERMETKGVFEDLFLSKTNEKVQQALTMSEYLSPRYQVVVANPPYFSKGMGADFKQFARDYYPDSKADTLSMFVERNLEFSCSGGYVGMVTLMSWMFLSSFEKFRMNILEQKTILTMAHLGAHAFDTIGGEVVSTTMFVLKNKHIVTLRGKYIRLLEGNSEHEKSNDLKEAIANPDSDWFFRAYAADFKKIPGAPIAYWINPILLYPFEKAKFSIGSISFSDGQTKTGNNSKYLRLHWEVSESEVGTNSRWWRHPKGGSFRKWFGNVEWIIDWSTRARKHYREDRVARILPEYLWGKQGLTWTLITSGKQSFRFYEGGQIFNLAAPTLFFESEEYLYLALGLLNTNYSSLLLDSINPTLNMNIGEVSSIPFWVEKLNPVKEKIIRIVKQCIEISEQDWDQYETSWDFPLPPLLNGCSLPISQKLSRQFIEIREHWRLLTQKMMSLEYENNSKFIECYGLQDEIDKNLPIEEITLICNPHYRYKGNYSEEELESRLLKDTMKEFISYAIGCTFGRYSLNKPGLILANQGEKIEDYRRIIVDKPTFSPTETNVIPIVEGEWFADDAVSRFKQFLRVTFGDENYTENLQFIEDALGKDLEKYFLRDFYKDHVQM